MILLRALRTSFAATLVLALTACGMQGAPDTSEALVDVTGRVTLPAGSPVALADLSVVTAFGDAPVGADGAFLATVKGSGPQELVVTDAAGRLVLIGRAADGSATASVDTTAAALVHAALGAFTLPNDRQRRVWDEVDALPGVTDVAALVREALLAGAHLPWDGGEALTEALEAARGPLPAALAPSVSPSDAAPPAVFGAVVAPSAASGNVAVTVEPGGGVLLGGAAVLVNPDGPGIVVQNHARRPGALLAYQVGYDELGGTVPIEPPVLVGRVEVPSTAKLELFEALYDVIVGDAPWVPVLSEPLVLPLHDGVDRTHYQLVLVGATTDVVTRPALYDDTRFPSAVRDEWREVVLDKQIESFLDDVALPLLETFVFGRTGVVEGSKLATLRREFRTLNDQQLGRLGVHLRAGGSYALAVSFLLEELVTSQRYRLDFLQVLREALSESERNRFEFEHAESRLRVRAGAAGVAAAVQVALAVGDLGAVLHDLANAPAAVGWTAVAAPRRFALSPESARVTRSVPQVEFTVAPQGEAVGAFRYRWSTTGRHGRLTDGPQTGIAFDTAYANVWYTHSNPLAIEDAHEDTVTVEVFEVATPTTPIAPGAEPHARVSATVRGLQRDIDPNLFTVTGDVPGRSYQCAMMLVRVAKDPSARTYTVTFDGFGGVGHPYNRNTLLRESSYVTYTIDPESPSPSRRILDWGGPCTGLDPDTGAVIDGTYVPFVTFDDGASYLLLVYYEEAGWTGSTPTGDYIATWLDWAAQGTLTITWAP
jgi:hypothetical protein